MRTEPYIQCEKSPIAANGAARAGLHACTWLGRVNVMRSLLVMMQGSFMMDIGLFSHS